MFIWIYFLYCYKTLHWGELTISPKGDLEGPPSSQKTPGKKQGFSFVTKKLSCLPIFCCFNKGLFWLTWLNKSAKS